MNPRSAPAHEAPPHDAREEADRCAMMRLARELVRSALPRRAACALHGVRVRRRRDGASALPRDARQARAAAAAGRTHRAGRRARSKPRRCARRGRRRRSSSSFIPAAPRPFDLDIHEIPERPGEPAHFHLDVRYLLVGQRRAVRGARVVRARRGGRRVGRPARGEGAVRVGSPSARLSVERARRAAPRAGSVAL